MITHFRLVDKSTVTERKARRTERDQAVDRCFQDIYFCWPLMICAVRPARDEVCDLFTPLWTHLPHCHLHALLTILRRPTSLQYCHFRDCKALLVTSLTHVSGAIASLLTFTCTYPLHLHDMSQCVVCVRRDQVNWVQHCVGHDTLWWRYRVPPW